MTTLRFPDRFIWGSASAAHQTEGSNTTSDHWALETSPNPPARVVEISGDACDSYHRYPTDIALLAGAGLTHYRFSIEWARIEPVEGVWLRAQLDHYRRMIECCLEHGVSPIVTLNHATVPAWLGRERSWNSERSANLFERYVRQVLPILSDVEWVCTINEPNMSAIFDGGLEPDYPGGLPRAKEPYATHLFEAHARAREAIKGARPETMVGWTVGCQAFDLTPDAGQAGHEYAWSREWRYLEAAKDDDFVGVQNYSRVSVGPNGPLPPEPGGWLNQLGWQVDPGTLSTAVETAHRLSGVPVLVTEHGMATLDDAERRRYCGASIARLHQTISEGTPVLGYVHWTLLDNYEWGSFEPKFGLVAVNRQTFDRSPKPSLAWLGAIARANAICSDDLAAPEA